jgi:hypothetical protein
MATASARRFVAPLWLAAVVRTLYALCLMLLRAFQRLATLVSYVFARFRALFAIKLIRDELHTFFNHSSLHNRRPCLSCYSSSNVERPTAVGDVIAAASTSFGDASRRSSATGHTARTRANRQCMRARDSFLLFVARPYCPRTRRPDSNQFVFIIIIISNCEWRRRGIDALHVSLRTIDMPFGAPLVMKYCFKELYSTKTTVQFKLRKFFNKLS